MVTRVTSKDPSSGRQCSWIYGGKGELNPSLLENTESRRRRRVLLVRKELRFGNSYPGYHASHLLKSAKTGAGYQTKIAGVDRQILINQATH
jgi:hypothetical protein